MTFKANFILSFFLLLNLSAKLRAQSPEFFSMDENFISIQKFYQTDTLLVIFPNSEPISNEDKEDVASYIFWGKKPVFIFKSEADITPKDLTKHLQLFGALFKFTNTYSEIPVKPIKNGFRYNNESFTRNNDAFYFLNDSSTVLYTCKNSTDALSPFSIYGVGAYQFYIYRDCNLYYSGYINLSTHQEQVNNIEKLKRQYFEQRSTRYFNLNIAKTLNVDSIHTTMTEELDKYTGDLCKYLIVDTSNIQKMNLYIYANRIDLQKFIAAPLWSTIWGKCMGNLLHSSNVNIATIKHETAHSIIFQKCGDYSNAFFDEGFRQYTEYLFNYDVFYSDREVTKANLGLLTKDLLMGGNNFYSNPQNYPISGVFTKYIIDKINFHEFKVCFSQKNLEKYLSDNFHLTMEELIQEFKNSLHIL